MSTNFDQFFGVVGHLTSNKLRFCWWSGWQCSCGDNCLYIL